MIEHAVKNTKYTNVKSVKLTKSKYNVAVGKTDKIKAKVVLVDKKKKAKVTVK